MHGLQHLFRQHAIEKQTSTDSWHSTYSNGRAISTNDSNPDLKSSPWSQGTVFSYCHQGVDIHENLLNWLAEIYFEI